MCFLMAVKLQRSITGQIAIELYKKGHTGQVKETFKFRKMAIAAVSATTKNT